MYRIALFALAFALPMSCSSKTDDKAQKVTASKNNAALAPAEGSPVPTPKPEKALPTAVERKEFDACALVSPESLSKALGLTFLPGREANRGRKCQWSSDPKQKGNEVVSIVFHDGPWEVAKADAERPVIEGLQWKAVPGFGDKAEMLWEGPNKLRKEDLARKLLVQVQDEFMSIEVVKMTMKLETIEKDIEKAAAAILEG